jgi:hypothetical protein
MPNAKNIQQVEELTEKLGKAKAIYFTEYRFECRRYNGPTSGFSQERCGLSSRKKHLD